MRLGRVARQKKEKGDADPTSPFSNESLLALVTTRALACDGRAGFRRGPRHGRFGVSRGCGGGFFHHGRAGRQGDDEGWDDKKG